jgi:hypothetical protein
MTARSAQGTENTLRTAQFGLETDSMIVISGIFLVSDERDLDANRRELSAFFSRATESGLNVVVGGTSKSGRLWINVYDETFWKKYVDLGAKIVDKATVMEILVGPKRAAATTSVEELIAEAREHASYGELRRVGTVQLIARLADVLEGLQSKVDRVERLLKQRGLPGQLVVAVGDALKGERQIIKITDGDSDTTRSLPER